MDRSSATGPWPSSWAERNILKYRGVLIADLKAETGAQVRETGLGPWPGARLVLDFPVFAGTSTRVVFVASDSSVPEPKGAETDLIVSVMDGIAPGEHPMRVRECDDSDLAAAVFAGVAKGEAPGVFARLVEAAARQKGADVHGALAAMIRALGDAHFQATQRVVGMGVTPTVGAVFVTIPSTTDDTPTIWCVSSDRVRKNTFKGRVVPGHDRSSLVAAVLDGTSDRLSPSGLAIDRVLIRLGESRVVWATVPARGPRLGPLMPRLGSKAPTFRHYVWRCLRTLEKKARLAPVLKEMAASTVRPCKPLALQAPPLRLTVDCAIPGPRGDVFVSGILFDPLGIIRSMVVRTPCGTTIPLGALQWIGPAPGGRDAPARFVALVRGGPREPDGAPVQYEVELETHGGFRHAVLAPAAPIDMRERRDAVLGAVAEAEELSAEIIESCLAPTIQSLQTHIRATGARLRDVVSFGDGPGAPRRSVVIPLYKRLDFLKFQVAWFSCDADMASTEIIYVLDSPEDEHRARLDLTGLTRTHGLPVRLAVMTRNVGYAAAVNTGVDLAEGRTLILLNSDVVPTQTGWMTALDDAAAMVARPGLVGPRLVFEDGSLQHAGLYFDRHVDGGWMNRHYWKGYPGTFAPALTRRRVPALTGACLRVDRDVYRQVGGLTEDYVIADYEDSDLGLKLFTAGYRHVYAGDVCLMHLERSSVGRHDGYQRTHVDVYNRWLHNRRWGDVMPTVMDACDAGTTTAPAHPPGSGDRVMVVPLGQETRSTTGHPETGG